MNDAMQSAAGNPNLPDRQHADGHAVPEAQAEGFRRHLDGLRTEPLSIAELATFFRVHRGTMRQLLKGMPVERVGRLYRVPLRDMPPAYHLERGLLPRPEG